MGTVACVTLLYILVYDQSCRPSAGRHLSGSIMQPIRAETQTAPPSANFEALALRGAPECARCDAKDGDYAFDRATKRLICTACAQNFIRSNNDTAWQHLHPKHRRARERMLIGLGGAFQVIEMPEMRAIVVECERNLWYNANSLTEYLDHSTLQRRLQHFVSTHQLDTGGSNPPSTRHSTAENGNDTQGQPLLFFGPTRDACTPLSTHKILGKSYAQKFAQSRWTCPLDHLLKYVHVPSCFCRLRFSPKCDPYYSQNQSQSSKEKERKE